MTSARAAEIADTVQRAFVPQGPFGYDAIRDPNVTHLLTTLLLLAPPAPQRIDRRSRRPAWMMANCARLALAGQCRINCRVATYPVDAPVGPLKKPPQA